MSFIEKLVSFIVGTDSPEPKGEYIRSRSPRRPGGPVVSKIPEHKMCEGKALPKGFEFVDRVGFQQLTCWDFRYLMEVPEVPADYFDEDAPEESRIGALQGWFRDRSRGIPLMVIVACERGKLPHVRVTIEDDRVPDDVHQIRVVRMPDFRPGQRRVSGQETIPPERRLEDKS